MRFWQKKFQLNNTNMTSSAITVKTVVHAPIEQAWKYWNEPEHIMRWCQASADWHVPRAENDLRVGGVFTTRMEAKDGSVGFDFQGTYSQVEENKKIAYAMSDGREVEITFAREGEGCKIVETFDPESENSHEMQKAGWQAILDSFKAYAEKQ